MSPAIECYFFKSSFRYPILIDTITINTDASLGGFVTFYERFMKFNYFALLAVATAALTACGGGGSSETAQQPVVTADAVDKYMGTWVACVAGTATTSTKETLVYTKASATSANVTFTQTSHAGTACAGSPTGSVYTVTSVATLAGTKTVGTSTADKVNITPVSPAGPDEKDISIIEGNTLKLGDETMLDTDGYPKAFENVYVYIKQSVAAAPLTGYSGTWVAACKQRSSITVNSAPAYVVGTINFNSASATKVSGSTSSKIFNNSTCTGAPAATSNQNFAFTIDGTVIINGKTVDKVTQTLEAIDPNAGPDATTINGVSYIANYFTRTDTFKTLVYINGNELFEGLGAGSATITVYPTSLQTTASATRQ